MRIPMLLMEGVKKWNFPFPREGRVGEGHFLLYFFLVLNGLKFNFRHRIFFMYRGVPPWGSSSPPGFIDTC